jgi:hypothetical protein
MRSWIFAEWLRKALHVLNLKVALDRLSRHHSLDLTHSHRPNRRPICKRVQRSSVSASGVPLPVDVEVDGRSSHGIPTVTVQSFQSGAVYL